jgi:hypothetical protein
MSDPRPLQETNAGRRPARLRRAAVAAAFVVVLASFFQTARRPRGDFPNHWEFGRRMAAGEFIYERGLDVPYLPLWALVHAPLTVLPVHAAQLVLFPLSLAAAALLLWVLDRLTRRSFPLDRERRFWVAALALLLSIRFLLRDMSECGVNLALVAPGRAESASAWPQRSSARHWPSWVTSCGSGIGRSPPRRRRPRLCSRSARSCGWGRKPTGGRSSSGPTTPAAG